MPASNSNWRRVLASSAATVAFFMPANTIAQILLDKLNRCDDIAQTLSAMATSWPPSRRECRKPTAILEKEISKYASGGPELCFLSQGPSPMLSGFACMTYAHPKGGSLLECFRANGASDIENYKRDYRQLLVKENEYLATASSCGQSNGDATHGGATMFPSLLSFISKFEFGFILPLGRGRKTDSLVQHGYASVDPAIGSNSPSAIEYFSVLISQPNTSDQTTSKEIKQIGPWALGIDDDAELSAEINKTLRSQGAPIWIRSASYSLSRRSEPSVSENSKSRALEKIGKTLVASLNSEGFRTVSDSEFEREAGMSKRDVHRHVVQSQPYGKRQFMSKGRMFEVLLLETTRSCTRDGTGALGAFVDTGGPSPLAGGSHYGDLTIVIIGLGTCSARGSRNYISRLMDQSSVVITESLENK